jgi:hypothetical protein
MLLPRLDRDSAIRIVDEHRHQPVGVLTATLPIEDAVPTYSPVGGARIDRPALAQLRRELLLLARDAGMPEAGTREGLQQFEGRAARLVRQHLDITAHEASQDDAWSYLTCCWLLDIAVWRFGWDTSIERFIGHLNRNTFRRMWWRAEILGDAIDLTRLGEDEFTNIMERPTLFSDRRLARAIAVEFLARVERHEAQERMRLMREVTKRLLRLTPFVAFTVLDEGDLRLVVADAFDAATAGMEGASGAMTQRVGAPGVEASSEVVAISTMTILPDVESTAPRSSPRARADGFEEVAQAALDIARRTGRVTNMSLREVVPITSEEARAVFQSLMAEGQLARRGVKRGTHYVLPDAQTNGSDGSSRGAASGRQPVRPPTGRPSETALRRLLRRGR